MKQKEGIEKSRSGNGEQIRAVLRRPGQVRCTREKTRIAKKPWHESAVCTVARLRSTWAPGAAFNVAVPSTHHDAVPAAPRPRRATARCTIICNSKAEISVLRIDAFKSPKVVLGDSCSEVLLWLRQDRVPTIRYCVTP